MGNFENPSGIPLTAHREGRFAPAAKESQQQVPVNGSAPATVERRGEEDGKTPVKPGGAGSRDLYVVHDGDERRWLTPDARARTSADLGRSEDADSTSARIGDFPTHPEADVIGQLLLSDRDVSAAIEDARGYLSTVSGAREGFTEEDLVRIANDTSGEFTAEEVAAARFLLTQSVGGRRALEMAMVEGRFYPGEAAPAEAAQRVGKPAVGAQGLTKQDLINAGLSPEQADALLAKSGTKVDGVLCLLEGDLMGLVEAGQIIVVEGDDGSTQLLITSESEVRIQAALDALDGLFAGRGETVDRATLETMVSPPEEAEAIFNLVVDSDGNVSQESLQEAIEAGLIDVVGGKIVLTEVGEQVADILAGADVDGDGVVTRDEIKAAYGDTMSPEQIDLLVDLYGEEDGVDATELANAIKDGFLVYRNELPMLAILGLYFSTMTNIRDATEELSRAMLREHRVSDEVLDLLEDKYNPPKSRGIRKSAVEEALRDGVISFDKGTGTWVLASRRDPS